MASGRKELDLAFAMDCTGSMGSHIETARQSIREVVEAIIAHEHADIRLALVEYRDHNHSGDWKEKVTRVLDFTPSLQVMKDSLDKSSAQDGGDGPEAVADALNDVLKLNWRDDSTKICVFISDAPPHGLQESGDYHPKGCPCKLDPMITSRELAAKGITVYAVGCEPSITPYRDWFMAIAHITGGQYVPLANAKLLSQVIIGGAREEISLQKLMAEVDRNVRQELAALPDGTADQSEIEKLVYKRMQAKGFKSKHLHIGDDKIPEVTDNARRFAEAPDMEAARELFKTPPQPTPRGHVVATPAVVRPRAPAAARPGAGPRGARRVAGPRSAGRGAGPRGAGPRAGPRGAGPRAGPRRVPAGTRGATSAEASHPAAERSTHLPRSRISQTLKRPAEPSPTGRVAKKARLASPAAASKATTATRATKATAATRAAKATAATRATKATATARAARAATAKAATNRAAKAATAKAATATTTAATEKVAKRGGYDVTEDEISAAQVSRLVEKSLHSSKLKAKCKRLDSM